MQKKGHWVSGGAATTYLGRGKLPSSDVKIQQEAQENKPVDNLAEDDSGFAENNKIGWKDGRPVVISRAMTQKPQNTKATSNNGAVVNGGKVSDTKALDDMLFDLERNYVMNPVHNRCRPKFQRTSVKSNESTQSRVAQTISRKPAFSKVQVCELTQETQQDDDEVVIGQGVGNVAIGPSAAMNNSSSLLLNNGKQLQSPDDSATSFLLHNKSGMADPTTAMPKAAMTLSNRPQHQMSGGILPNNQENFSNQQGENNANSTSNLLGAHNPDDLSIIDGKPQNNSWSINDSDANNNKKDYITPIPVCLLPEDQVKEQEQADKSSIILKGDPTTINGQAAFGLVALDQQKNGNNVAGIEEEIAVANDGNALVVDGDQQTRRQLLLGSSQDNKDIGAENSQIPIGNDRKPESSSKKGGALAAGAAAGVAATKSSRWNCLGRKQTTQSTQNRDASAANSNLQRNNNNNRQLASSANKRAVGATVAAGAAMPFALEVVEEVLNGEESKNSQDASQKANMKPEQRGSMHHILNKKPAPIDTSRQPHNTEECYVDKFFTTEGTPIHRRPHSYLNLQGFRRSITARISDIAANLERQKRLKRLPLFENLFCRGLSWVSAGLGTAILAISLVVDLTYVSTSVFASQFLYVLCILLISARFLVPFLNTLRFYCIEMEARLREEHDELKQLAGVENEDNQDENERNFRRNGVMLYLAVPLSQVTGIYRMLNFRNFHKDVAFGLALDCLLNMLAMLIVLAINNSKLNSQAAIKGIDYELTQLQSFAVLLKGFMLLLLILESIMYILQVRYLHQSVRVGRVNDYQAKMHEREKRGFYGVKYFSGSVGWFTILMLAFVAVVAQLDLQECRVDQVRSGQNEQICLDCSVENCDQCLLSGASGCDKCKEGFYLDKSEPDAVTCIDEKCRISQCKTCTSKGPFVCDACEDGFEINESTGICKSSTCTDVNCKQCTNYDSGICDICFSTHEWDRTSSICADTRCKLENCLLCGAFGESEGCDLCARDYAFDAQLGQCKLQCTDKNCADCAGDVAVCQTCKENFWLDKTTNPQEPKCIDGTCLIQECKTCNEKGPTVCDACNDGFELDSQGLICQSSVCKDKNCRVCTSDINACDECLNGFTWDSEWAVCASTDCQIKDCETCHKNPADQSQKCVKCADGLVFDQIAGICAQPCSTPNCASCPTDPSKCEACTSDAFWLDKATNQCIDATCQIEFCDKCSVSGPSVCDQCQNGFQLIAAIGGLCKSTDCPLNHKFNDQTGECDDTVCKKEHCLVCEVSGIHDGCDRCKDGYHFVQASKECERDGTCNVQDCAKCEADPAVCEQCTTGFWLDQEANTCIDATCQVLNCDNCAVSGPSKCDTCARGFFASEDGTACDDCDADSEKVICEQCSDASKCDKCIDGFRVDEDGMCLDLTCQVSECATCATHPATCEQCNEGFWLDKDTNTCVDATCQVDNCDECSISGPTKCDSCKVGFFAQDEKTCADCDSDPTKVMCEQCSDAQTCQKCAEGYFLEDAQCKTCDLTLCKECDPKTGKCIACKENQGLYLDSATNKCLPCTPPCLECLNPDVCLLCSGEHLAQFPPDGKCRCDIQRGWVTDPSQSNPAQCICNKPWLDQFGQCTSCQDFYQGCSECKRIDNTEQIEQIITVESPASAKGSYICNQCSEENTFFNLELQFCMRCDRDVSGCKRCSDGVCSECLEGFVSNGNGGCFDCKFHDSECIQCTTDKCTECLPGLLLTGIPGAYCVGSPL